MRRECLVPFLVFVTALLGNLAPRQAQQVSGIPPIPWVKEPGIRLNLDAGDPPGTAGLQRPFVRRFPNGTWRMYYGTSAGISSASSSDGLAWTKEAGIRITPAAVGAGGVAIPVVVHAGPSLFRMYFRSSFPLRLQTAVSTDGLTWVPEGIRLDEDVVDFAVVGRPGGGFRAYYIVSPAPHSAPLPVVSAVSTDGLTWTPEAGIRHPGVLYFTASRLDDEKVVLTYATDFFSTLSARSTDGLNFTNDAGVRLLPGNHPDSNPLESATIFVCSLVQFPDGKVRGYYQGSSTGDINNPARIFSAVAASRHAADPLGRLKATTWTKESGIRLDLDGFEPVGTTSLLMPWLFRFPDGTLRAYYTAYPTDTVLSAVSADGLTWAKEPGARLSFGSFGDAIRAVCVVEAGPGLYRMYAGANQVYSALSTDGLTWTPEAGVRLSQAHYPKVVAIESGGYRMYFWKPNTVNVGSAISSDGINWSQEAGNRLLGAVSLAVATLQNGRVKICYTDAASHEMRTAHSTNGLDFVLEPGFRLTPGGPDGTGANGTMAPSALVQFYDGTVRLYYTASADSFDVNASGRVHSAVAAISELTMDRGEISALAGGIKRYCLRGEPFSNYLVLGSMSGPSNQSPGCETNPLIQDDYYRTTQFGGDPMMSRSSGAFNSTGIEVGVYLAPPGLFMAGESVWHSLRYGSSACPPLPPPPPPRRRSGPVTGGLGGLAASASSPVRVKVN